MPDFFNILIFASAAFVLTATPGPDMLLIASRSFSQGRPAGFLTFAGIAGGTFIHALLAGLGLSSLIVAFPLLYDVIRYAGCIYLLYLAYKTLRSARPVALAATRLKPLSARRIFLEGLMTNLLNPKMALFVLALFPQFTRPDSGPILVQMLVLALVLNVVGFGVNGLVIVLGSQIRARLAAFSRFPKLPNYLLAGVFTGLALRLAVGSRS